MVSFQGRSGRLQSMEPVPDTHPAPCLSILHIYTLTQIIFWPDSWSVGFGLPEVEHKWLVSEKNGSSRALIVYDFDQIGSCRLEGLSPFLLFICILIFLPPPLKEANVPCNAVHLLYHCGSQIFKGEIVNHTCFYHSDYSWMHYKEYFLFVSSRYVSHTCGWSTSSFLG